MSSFVALDTLRECRRRDVNLLGVVVEYSVPKPTRISNFMMSLKIVDRSLQEINVNMFMGAVTDFPVVKAFGDVIYLNNVKVDMYDNKPSAVFRKERSYFSIYSGSAVGDFVPYLPRSPFSLTDLVKKEIDRLRLWYRNSQLNTGESKYLITISNLLQMQFFDLVCKVLFTRVENENAPHCFCLYVWDGTDAPLEDMNTEFREENQNPPTIDNGFDSIPGDILRSFPQAGTVLKVIIEVSDDGLGDHFNLTGSWVRLRNIHCKSSHNKWHLTSTILKIRRLLDNDLIVQERQRTYEQRIREMNASNE
ncbi:unnamed protein product [Rhodiola kirilowii]